MQDGPSSKPKRPDWLPLVALIMLSFVLRLPRVGAMDSMFDYLTSHTVLITRVWQMTGLANAHYSLVSNWPNPSDRYAEHGVAALFDQEGNTYFLSFPPLAFYLSYGFFQLIGAGATAFPLRALMLLASALGAWALFRLVRRLWPDSGALPSSLAAAVFLLSPVSLYYYAQAFFPLILSVPMWLGVVLLFYRARESGAWVPRLACGAGCFVLCYTDWLGYLAVFAFSLVCLRRRDLKLAAALCLPAALALAITLSTYASIAGWPALWASMTEKYLQRSGFKGYRESYAAYNPRAYLSILYIYELGFFPWALPFAAGAIAWFLGRRQAPAGQPTAPPAPRSMWELLFLLALPVFLDHAGLINHTAMHRYAVLKSAPAIGVALAMLIGLRFSRRLLLVGLLGAVTIGLCTWGFLRQHFRTDPELAAIAQHVNYRTGLNDVLFMQRSRWLPSADPSLLLMIERNLHFVDNRAEAEAFLRRTGAAKGHYLRLLRATPPVVDGEPFYLNPPAAPAR